MPFGGVAVAHPVGGLYAQDQGPSALEPSGRAQLATGLLGPLYTGWIAFQSLSQLGRAKLAVSFIIARVEVMAFAANLCAEWTHQQKG